MRGPEEGPRDVTKEVVVRSLSAAGKLVNVVKDMEKSGPSIQHTLFFYILFFTPGPHG